MTPELCGMMIDVKSLDCQFDRYGRIHLNLSGYVSKIVGNERIGNQMVLNIRNVTKFVLIPVNPDLQDLTNRLAISAPAISGDEDPWEFFDENGDRIDG